ncbi:MAG: tRNA (cytidine(34)-2'-O)-methyltransferase [Candidatus Thioglobus sp.]|nr:MAG: tRNA (cytidine(34)-2'-O)-methyltransferase [Candidatus Thioglobus sp.]
MFQIVLYQPEIPPNTGNIIRLCANTRCSLHLIEPLGFSISDRELRRAGLDYAKNVELKTYESIQDYASHQTKERLFTFSTKHNVSYTQCDFQPGDSLIFGPETRGLPDMARELATEQHRVTIPMAPSSRSLNLSNSVAIAVYEAWRQNEFSTV